MERLENGVKELRSDFKAYTEGQDKKANAIMLLIIATLLTVCGSVYVNVVNVSEQKKPRAANIIMSDEAVKTMAEEISKAVKESK